MTSSRNHLHDIATRNQVYLEHLKSHLVDNAKATLDQLDSSIVEIVRALGAEKMSDLTRAELQNLLVDVKEAQLEVMTRVIDDLVPDLVAVAKYEGTFEERTLREQTKAKIATLKADAAYKAALRDPVSATGDKLPELLTNWSTSETEAVSKLLSRGYTNGWTNQEMVQAIQGTKKLGYTDGILARMDSTVSTVVRTSVQHVASAAREAVWANNSDVVEEYTIVATLDGNTTAICRSLDGNTYKLGEGPTPPFHWGCRTTTAAVVKSEFDFLNKGATRSSENGYVDASQTYYGWLADQPAAFQDSTLGPVRGQLFRDGGLTSEEFARLNLGRNFHPMTLEEMQKLEPHAFERAGIQL